VTKGQLCAQIDPGPYQTALEEADANLSTAKAQLEKDQASLSYAKLTYDRTQDLAQRGTVTRDAVDSSKSASDQAEAQIASISRLLDSVRRHSTQRRSTLATPASSRR
jgi:HlyD family secretion protein